MAKVKKVRTADKVNAVKEYQKKNGTTLAAALKAVGLSYGTWQYQQKVAGKKKPKRQVVRKREFAALMATPQAPKKNVGRVIALVGSAADVAEAFQTMMKGE